MYTFLWDVSGAFGDIGVLFPLAVALIAKNGMNPTAFFLMAGLFYVAAALYFRITMPVQPLKAMSAIAVASGLGYAVINAAGIVMGFILILLTVTGMSARLGGLFPTSVIRGIQLGLGAMLVRTSLGLMSPDIVIAIVAGIILVITMTLLKKIPPLLPLLVLGAALSLRKTSLSSMGPVALTPIVPCWDGVWQGFTVLVMPQIALTFGNAIVATNERGRLLYGERAQRLNLKSIPLSMGIANIASGLVGGAPMCHGCAGSRRTISSERPAVDRALSSAARSLFSAFSSVTPPLPLFPLFPGNTGRSPLLCRYTACVIHRRRH